MSMKIAALIPCYNEELTIKKVIDDFRKCVPEADIYVFDNNSTDKTASIVEAVGVKVMHERRQGKGYVMQSMFDKIEADIYIMVDGDDTYDLSEVPNMLHAVQAGEADMIVGNRLKKFTNKSFKNFHTFGNKLVRALINVLFKAKLQDIMSGLRVMSRRFIKNINIMSSGFEVETEMTIKAIKYGFVIKEVDINYKERPEGSFSKLNTFKDGFKVLKTIFSIFKNYKPLLFFSILAFIFFVISCLTGVVVVLEFVRTSYITHVPLTIFASGTMLLAIILLITGVILDVISRRFDELHNLVQNRKFG